MRASDAMNAVGLNSDGRPIDESWLVAKCPGCDAETTLASAETVENGQQTDYHCPECGSVFVTVSPAPGLGGYRLGDNVVSPLAGMTMQIPPADS